MDIANSVAIVTGANRGIGEAFVRALIGQGAAKVYAVRVTPPRPSTWLTSSATRLSPSLWMSPRKSRLPRPQRNARTYRL